MSKLTWFEWHINKRHDKKERKKGREVHSHRITMTVSVSE